MEELPGGIEYAIRVLRASSLPDARAFIAKYDDVTLPRYQKEQMPLEAFAVAAKVPGDRILNALVQSEKAYNALKGASHAARNHPAIVTKSTELALTGDLDHTVLNMKQMGFLPAPKGSQVSINVAANASAAAPIIATLAPSPERSIRELQDRFNAPPKLAAGEPVPESPAAVDGEYESEDDGE